MQNWKRNLMLLLAGAFVLPLLVVGFSIILLPFLIDLWWFDSLNYQAYFWLRLLYRYIISGGVTIVFFSIFSFNFWLASRYLSQPTSPAEAGGGAQKRRELIRKFKTGSLDVYLPLSLLLAIAIAIPFYREWEQSLLLIFGSASGVVDPVYGKDISYYLFAFPLYLILQKELLLQFSILFLFIAALYWLEHRLVRDRKNAFPLGAKIHLTALILLIFLIQTWGYVLQLYRLLFVSDHEPAFFGPGFVEMWYELPLIWTSMITFLGTAVSSTVMIHSQTRKGKTLFVIFGLCFLAALGLRSAAPIKNAINQYLVKPNPVKLERGFMKYNIEATLAAYGLDNVKRIPFPVTLYPEQDLAKWFNEEHLRNIPVWDREFLDDVYNQLQGLRPYYHFPNVDEDRYLIDGSLQQVNLAAREVIIEKLPEAARNWENMYLRYTHGFGAVITPAAQQGGQPMEWYLRGLNLYSPVGFMIEKPNIFFGLEEFRYAIVPNKLEVVDLAGTDPKAMETYAGRGGVPIGSLFRKFLFALHFRHEQIFFSLNIADDSKVLFRRHIVERIKTLTPFLQLDNDPYLVVTPSRLFWIADAYTTSNWYPIAQSSVTQFASHPDAEDRTFNYIRNSVKVVVDAYDGTVDYYIADPKDPIVQAYRRAYPNFFKDLTQMPAELKSHLRYPRDIFRVQMGIYAKYHQVEPELFFQQSEAWSFAQYKSVSINPYYLTTELEHCPQLRKFVQIAPMTPIERDNLSVLAIAGSLTFEECGIEYSPGIALYEFPRDTQVDGPAQVSALIDQDPTISRQLALWDLRGSQVFRGRMIVLPVAHSMLYVQPIYLVSTTRTKIPELVRIIVSMGNVAVMEKSLAEGLNQLRQRLERERGGTAIRESAPVLPEPPTPEAEGPAPAGE